MFFNLIKKLFGKKKTEESSLFVIDKDNWWSVLESSMPSDASSVCRMTEDVIYHLSEKNWTEDLMFGIQLALEEALMNAAKHGNKFSSDKKVSIRCGISENLVRIEVADEGEGFNPEKVIDPTCDVQVSKPNGRGVYLMKTFMERVEYNASGNKVFMEKRKHL